MLKVAGLVAVVIAFGALQTGLPRAGATSPPPSMNLFASPQSMYGPPLVQQFIVNADVNGITSMGAFSFDIHFDDSVVSFSQATPGPVADQYGAPICSPSSLPGQMSYSCRLTGGPVSGSGSVAQVEFMFDHGFVGVLNFSMANCQAADPLGNPIPLNGCTGTQITVIPLPAPAPMTMTPATTKIQALMGSTFTIDVLIGDVIDLGGVEFNVTFDASKLTLTNVTEGPFLANTPGHHVCFFHPPPAPFHEFSCAGLSKDAAATGSGVIAHVEFTVKAPFAGTTAGSLADCNAADINGFPIPVNNCGGAMVESNPTQAVGGLSYDPPGPEHGTRAPWLPFALATSAIVLFAAAAWAALLSQRATR